MKLHHANQPAKTFYTYISVFTEMPDSAVRNPIRGRVFYDVDCSFCRGLLGTKVGQASSLSPDGRKNPAQINDIPNHSKRASTREAATDRQDACPTFNKEKEAA